MESNIIFQERRINERRESKKERKEEKERHSESQSYIYDEWEREKKSLLRLNLVKKKNLTPCFAGHLSPGRNVVEKVLHNIVDFA